MAMVAMMSEGMTMAAAVVVDFDELERAEYVAWLAEQDPATWRADVRSLAAEHPLGRWYHALGHCLVAVGGAYALLDAGTPDAVCVRFDAWATAFLEECAARGPVLTLLGVLAAAERATRTVAEAQDTIALTREAIAAA